MSDIIYHYCDSCGWHILVKDESIESVPVNECRDCQGKLNYVGMSKQEHAVYQAMANPDIREKISLIRELIND